MRGAEYDFVAFNVDASHLLSDGLAAVHCEGDVDVVQEPYAFRILAHASERHAKTANVHGQNALDEMCHYR